MEDSGGVPASVVAPLLAPKAENPASSPYQAVVSIKGGGGSSIQTAI